MTAQDDKKLTIEEANAAADGVVLVTRDDVDGRLWRVEDDHAVEVHEPMTRDEFARFLAEW